MNVANGILLDGDINIDQNDFFVNNVWDDPNSSQGANIPSTMFGPKGEGSGSGARSGKSVDRSRTLSGMLNMLDGLEPPDGLSLHSNSMMQGSREANDEQMLRRLSADLSNISIQQMRDEISAAQESTASEVAAQMPSAASTTVPGSAPQLPPARASSGKPPRGSKASASSAAASASAESPPPSFDQDSADAENEPDRLHRRRQQKREYSRKYRVDQKTYISQLEADLSQARMACEYAMQQNVTLQVQIAQLMQSQAKGGSSSEVVQLKETIESLRDDLKKEKERVDRRDAWVLKLLERTGGSSADLESAVSAVLDAKRAAGDLAAMPPPAPSSDAPSGGANPDLSMKSVGNPDSSMRSNPDVSSDASRRNSSTRQSRSSKAAS